MTANLLMNFEGPRIIEEEEIISVVHDINADGVGAQNHKFLNLNFYKKISDEKKKVHVWTVNSGKEAEKYHELGLSSITTNCPGRIKKHLSNSI